MGSSSLEGGADTSFIDGLLPCPGGSKKKKAGAKVKGSSSKGFAAKLAAATAPSEKSAGGSGKAASSVPEGTEVLLVLASWVERAASGLDN